MDRRKDHKLKRTLSTVVLVIGLLSPFLVASCAAQDRINGDWVGEFRLKDKTVGFRVHIDGGVFGTDGSAEIPEEDEWSGPLERLKISSERVHFELPSSDGVLVYDGTATGGNISGSVRREDAAGDFTLIHVANLKAGSYSKIAGSYDLGGDDFISIGPFDDSEELGALPQFMDFQSGRWGMLHALSDNTYFSGPALAEDFPIDIYAKFNSNEKGEIVSVTWKEKGKAERTALKAPYSQKEVAFRDGTVTLSGTLTTPVTPGPYPCVVIVHGSGPETRKRGSLPYFFYRLGVAVLAYDKRGTGSSTGDWRTCSLLDLANDATAAVKYLQSQADIDPKRIGLFGASNGGWVAPIAASRSADIAFVIARSASGLPENENRVFERIHVLPERIARGGYDLKASLASRDPLDPAYFWQRVSCPALVLEAEEDRQVPAKESAAIIEEALKAGNNKNYSVMTFPHAHHSMTEIPPGPESERAKMSRANRYVSGYLTTVANWLQKQLNLGPIFRPIAGSNGLSPTRQGSPQPDECPPFQLASWQSQR